VGALAEKPALKRGERVAEPLKGNGVEDKKWIVGDASKEIRPGGFPYRPYCAEGREKN